MLAIECKNISKQYNSGLFKKKTQAVKGLSLEVVEGEVLGLIGPNGAGKSTTIRMLLGLSRPDSGSILFRGKPLENSTLQREIGYLPENPYLYDHLSLVELLDFCGRTSGLDASSISKRGQALMSKLNLLEVQKRPLRTFSKGMLQRSAICFALLHDPDIVVFDEPMSGLDPIGRKMVFDLVQELKGQGKTIFFCSHILSDVERLCDRIGLIAKGSLIRQFERNDFMHNDAETVFLHTSRLLDGQIDALNSMGVRVRDESEGHIIAIPADKYFPVNEFIKNSGVKILGCRAEWMSLEDLFMQNLKEQSR